MGSVISIHVADIHFGCKADPREEYLILKEQLVNRVDRFHFDIFSIDGDLFDRKLMSNTEAVRYATMFVADVVSLCRRHKATLIIIEGTKSHDAGQLKLFHHYMYSPDDDIRIVDSIEFVYTKGVKILCIPELYGVDESVYQNALKDDYYDMCFMHGTFEGAVYGNNVGRGRLFTIEDFIMCKGPIISGHVHTGGVFSDHFYYTGSPIRYEFGQEEPKGFLVNLYDSDSRRYFMHKSIIESYRYDTIDISTLGLAQPKDILNHIEKLHTDGVHYIRVVIGPEMKQEDVNIFRTACRDIDYVKVKIREVRESIKTPDDVLRTSYEQYAYLVDKTMSPFDKLAKYINDCEGSVVISADDIERLYKEK